MPQRQCKGQQARVGGHGVHRQRGLAPPVGEAVFGGAGHIDLQQLATHVLQLHTQQPAGRAGEVAVDGVHQRGVHVVGQLVQRGGHTFGRQAFALQRGGQAQSVLRAGLQFGGAGGLAGEELQPGLHGQVFALPEAAQRGQVMRAGHGQGLGGPGGGRGKALGGRIALEEQRAVGQQRARLHGAAHGGRDVAQVFADDHTAVAHALQRQDAQQGVERVGGIGALPSTHIVWWQPEQAHQAHHMVEPQGAGVPHVGTQGVNERGEAQGPQAQRVERRQAPVLAQRVEWVGRRAHVHAQRIGAALAPGVGTAFVHTHGQVAVEAQAHAQCLGMGLCGLQLRLGQPLQPAVVLQLLGMGLGELLHGGCFRVAPGLGPGGPAPHRRVCGHEMGLQCLEQGMQAQAFALALHKAVELRSTGGAVRQMFVRKVLPQ